MKLSSALGLALTALLLHKGRAVLTGLGIVIGIGAVGSTPELQEARNWQIADGRYFNQEEVRQAAPVCVLGQTVYRKLFPARQNAIGEWLRLDHLQLQIVGVTAPKGYSPTGVDQDD